MTSHPFHRILVASALLAAVSSMEAAAGGSVDLQLRGNDKVSGTLRPAYDEECFTCEMPQGAVLVATLKGKSPTGPAVQLALRQGGVDVPGTTFVPIRGGVKLQPFTAPSSGLYQLCVTGNNGQDGDYDIAVTWKSRNQWKGAGGPVASGVGATFDFDAPAGASATIAVAPAPHSAFVAQLVDMTGPNAFTRSLAAVTPRTSIALPATGQYHVNFTNGGADGLWAATVKLKLKKTPSGRIDIRDGKLTGAFGDGHVVFGRAVGPDGGTVDLTATISSPLDGTSVTIPPGTLGAPTVITVSAAPSLTPGGGDHPAGPAVDFGPSGTVFDPSGNDVAKQATITIPFDPAYFPSGTSSLVIYVRAADGTLTQVPQPYVITGNTVTFTTSHFSTYQAAATGPRALVGRFLVLEIGGDEKDAFAGKFGFGLHSLDADPQNGTNVFTNSDSVDWASSLAQGGSSAVLTTDSNSNPVNVTIPDDQTVVLDDPAHPGEAPTFRRGASDDVLVGVKKTLLALRRAPAGTTTVATIAGRWHLFHYQFDSQPMATQPPFASLSISADMGVMTLAPDGTVTFDSIRSAESNSLFPTGTWTPKTDNNPPTGLTWSVPDDFVQLTLPERSQPVHLNAVLDGDVLIGRSSSPGGSPPPDDKTSTDMFLLVRASSGAKLGPLAGDYFTAGGEADTVDRNPTGQGIDLRVETLTVTIAKSGDISLLGTRDLFSHDGQGVATSQLDQTVAKTSGHLTLKPDGSFTEAGGAVGAFTRGGALFVHAQFDGQTFSMDFGTPLVLTGR